MEEEEADVRNTKEHVQNMMNEGEKLPAQGRSNVAQVMDQWTANVSQRLPSSLDVNRKVADDLGGPSEAPEKPARPGDRAGPEPGPGGGSSPPPWRAPSPSDADSLASLRPFLEEAELGSAARGSGRAVPPAGVGGDRRRAPEAGMLPRRARRKRLFWRPCATKR